MTGGGPGQTGLLVAATDDARLAHPDFDARLGALLAAGCPAVWLRSRALPSSAFLALARSVGARCHAHGASLWVGDRVDVASRAGADHLQLPERGPSIAGARRSVGAGATVGRSVHSANAARIAARDGADLVVAGPVYPSRSHPERGAGGRALLEAVRTSLAVEGRPEIRLVAIGGLTPPRAAEARAAGADGVAAIRALWEADDPGEAVGEFLDALRRPG